MTIRRPAPFTSNDDVCSACLRQINDPVADAAPDLLAALQGVEQAQRDGDYGAAFAAVRAAIAKATT